MLYGIQTGFGSPQVPVAELLARPAPTLLSPQNLRPKSSNFLQVPDIESPRPKSVPSSPMVKRAFSRLGTITAGWGRSIRKQQSQLNADDKKKWASSQDCSGSYAPPAYHFKSTDFITFPDKDGKESSSKSKANAGQLAVPRLSVCADAQKVDRAKLAQTEFTIIEFDPETFRVLLDYLHTGSCPLTCISIPGLICAAEHYDLPELLQACFHHAKQFLRIDAVCPMLTALENYYWRYTSASELVNMILAFVETRAYALFQTAEFLTLSESMVQMIMCRNLEIPEVRKFEAMLAWAKHKVDSIIQHHLPISQCIFSYFSVGEIQGIGQNGRQGRIPLHHGTPSQGPETAPNLTAGTNQDRASVEGDQKRTHLGNADVPGEQWHVPDTGQLSRGLPATAAETGLPLQRVGRELRLWLIGRGSAVVKQLILVISQAVPQATNFRSVNCILHYPSQTRPRWAPIASPSFCG